MSLRVWLPLNKDLRQQGLANISMINHNTTLNTNGKLGSCYYFNGNQQWIQFDSVLGNFYNNDWSIACWLKPTDSTRGVIISEYNGSGASNVAIELSADRVVRLYWNGTPDIYFSTAGALPLNVWTHLVMTKKGREIKVYFDGNLKQTYTYTSDFSTRTSACQPRIGDDYRGDSANTVSYQGYINDFRMYDHCLSEQEVKKLAQGLIVHYLLNRNGLGQENLWRNGSCQDNLDGMAQSTNKFTITTKDGYKCAYLSGALATTGYLGIPDAMIPTVGEWYTISADMRIDNYIAGSTNPYVGLYFGGDYLNTDNTGGWYGGSSYSGDGKADAHTFVNTYNNKGWHHVTCTVQYLHGGNEYKKGAFRMGYVYARDFTGDLYVKNIKFEKGKIATPYSKGPSVVNTDLTSATTVAGVTYTPGGFSNISVNGTSTGTGACYLQTLKAVAAGIYTAHCYGGLSSDGVRFIPYKTSNGTTSYYDMTTSGSKTIYVAPGDTYGYYLRTNGNNVAVNTTVWAFYNFEPLTEYDISGFGNNGTRVGSMTWSSDTPKYSVSTSIVQGLNFIQLPVINPTGFTNSWTFAMWVKANDPDSFMTWGTSNGNRLNLFITSSYVANNTGDSGENPFQKNGTNISPSLINNNIWHHIVVTGNGSTNILYIDGNEAARAKTYKPLTGTQYFISGWDTSNTSYRINGSVSDFRLYATALSANDVKSLYQNCATIGPDGTIYGKIRS